MITGDEGNDVIIPGDGVDRVFGEEGFDTIWLTDDDAYDRIYCGACLERPARRQGVVKYEGARRPAATSSPASRGATSSRIRAAAVAA